MSVQWSKQNKLENCSKSTVKMSMEKPVLLNFMNLLTRFFTRLQCIFFFDKIQKKSPKNSPPQKKKKSVVDIVTIARIFFKSIFIYKFIYLQASLNLTKPYLVELTGFGKLWVNYCFLHIFQPSFTCSKSTIQTPEICSKLTIMTSH